MAPAAWTRSTSHRSEVTTRICAGSARRDAADDLIVGRVASRAGACVTSITVEEIGGRGGCSNTTITSSPLRRPSARAGGRAGPSPRVGPSTTRPAACRSRSSRRRTSARHRAATLASRTPLGHLLESCAGCGSRASRRATSSRSTAAGGGSTRSSRRRRLAAWRSRRSTGGSTTTAAAAAKSSATGPSAAGRGRAPSRCSRRRASSMTSQLGRPGSGEGQLSRRCCRWALAAS